MVVTPPDRLLAPGAPAHDPPRAAPPGALTFADGLVLYLYLAAGGVIGTLARYGLGQWIPGWAGTDFPWHTFAINVAGSLVLYRLAGLS